MTNDIDFLIDDLHSVEPVNENLKNIYVCSAEQLMPFEQMYITYVNNKYGIISERRIENNIYITDADRSIYNVLNGFMDIEVRVYEEAELVGPSGQGPKAELLIYIKSIMKQRFTVSYGQIIYIHIIDILEEFYFSNHQKLMLEQAMKDYGKTLAEKALR